MGIFGKKEESKNSKLLAKLQAKVDELMDEIFRMKSQQDLAYEKIEHLYNEIKLSSTKNQEPSKTNNVLAVDELPRKAPPQAVMEIIQPPATPIKIQNQTTTSSNTSGKNDKKLKREHPDNHGGEKSSPKRAKNNNRNDVTDLQRTFGRSASVPSSSSSHELGKTTKHNRRASDF